eukprot:gb/GECG01010658.1/.p1 GENE.gb/GECG01010658.1/~~gb/GECG01010658.1/.p1  ORF type:complete len:113 (+),score=1.49 gb/GECG01010658.1/:1-339(+)
MVRQLLQWNAGWLHAFCVSTSVNNSHSQCRVCVFPTSLYVLGYSGTPVRGCVKLQELHDLPILCTASECKFGNFVKCTMSSNLCGKTSQFTLYAQYTDMSQRTSRAYATSAW